MGDDGWWVMGIVGGEQWLLDYEDDGRWLVYVIGKDWWIIVMMVWRDSSWGIVDGEIVCSGTLDIGQCLCASA